MLFFIYSFILSLFHFNFLLDVIFMNSKMVRTKGGGLSNSGRVRPIASVRRRRGGPSTSVLNKKRLA